MIRHAADWQQNLQLGLLWQCWQCWIITYWRCWIYDFWICSLVYCGSVGLIVGFGSLVYCGSVGSVGSWIIIFARTYLWCWSKIQQLAHRVEQVTAL